MKLIFICRGDPLVSSGGTEIFAGNLAKELGKHDVVVSVIHASERFSTNQSPKLNNVEFIPLRLTGVPYLRSIDYRRKCAKACLDLVRKSKVDAIIEFGAGTFGFHAFNQVKKLKERPICIFYAMDTMFMEYERGKKSTQITSLLSTCKRWFWYNALIKSDKASCSSSDLIISSSKDTSVHLIADYGIKPEKVRLLYEGIPSDYADGYEVVDPSSPVFFHVGGGERKGTDYFLQALKQLKDKYGINARGVIARAAQANINYAKKLGVDVEMHARLELDDLKRQYASCTAFVSPSLSEGFCLPIVEAEMFGKPCVVTNVGSLPELITDDENGCIVSPADADALTEKLWKLAINKEFRAKLGTNARNHGSQFTITRTAANLTRVLK